VVTSERLALVGRGGDNSVNITAIGCPVRSWNIPSTCTATAYREQGAATGADVTRLTDRVAPLRATSVTQRDLATTWVWLVILATGRRNRLRR
jgi:hypothetical protein